MTETADVDSLRFIRIIDPSHIPRHLVEQVRDRDFSVEKFYDYQRLVCVEQVNGAWNANPLNLLFVIVDPDNKVQGFMWAVVDPLYNALCINTFSMEPKYWHGGRAAKLLARKGHEIMEGAKLSKCYLITNFPKHSERYGFKRSKSVLMEYKGELAPNGEDYGKVDGGQQSKTSGHCPDDDSRTTRVLEDDVIFTGSECTGGI